MVEMDMGDDQCLNALDIEAERRGLRIRRRLIPLLKAAINQQANGGIKVQLMAGPSDTPGTTMMGKAGIFHAAHTRLDRK